MLKKEKTDKVAPIAKYKALRLISAVNGQVFYYNVQKQAFEAYLEGSTSKEKNEVTYEIAERVKRFQIENGVHENCMKDVELEY